MAAGIHLEAQFQDLFSTTSLPVLDLLMLDELGLIADPLPQLFNMESADREIVQNTKIDSLGIFESASEAEVAPLDAFQQSFDKTYTVVTYKKRIAISKEMIRDSRFGLIEKMIRSIGRSAQETRMVKAASVFNNAFTTETAHDGVAIISASHPSQIGNQSNTLAAQSDLTATSLKEAETIFRNTQDSQGKRLNIMPAVLLVEPNNMHNARELTMSPFLPGTGNNNINSIGRHVVVDLPHLTDTDGWFLMAQPRDHGLRFITRQPLETESELDRKAGVLHYVGDMRFIQGADEWRGIVGSDGSAS